MAEKTRNIASMVGALATGTFLTQSGKPNQRTTYIQPQEGYSANNISNKYSLAKSKVSNIKRDYIHNNTVLENAFNNPNITKTIWKDTNKPMFNTKRGIGVLINGIVRNTPIVNDIVQTVNQNKINKDIQRNKDHYDNRINQIRKEIGK